MSKRISPTLQVNGKGEIVCVQCGHGLGPAGAPWKQNAKIGEKPMRGVGGAPYSAGENVLLRSFFCPGCGALLDTETAMPGDPFLDDVLQA